MNNFEVEEPILNSPFSEPAEHWYIRTGEPAEKRPGRRPAIVYPPRDERHDRHVNWSLADGTLKPSTDHAPGYEMLLVNTIRERVKDWRNQGYPGVTGTTLDLLRWWQREGRDERKRLFFAQIEAAETIIFLTEARPDFRQGIAIPRDEPSDDRKELGFAGFDRRACKMATGSGKTTVMGMLSAWSILNKVNDRGNASFSDVVLIVCPNVTIRDRLKELDPNLGDTSLYRTRDLVPPHLMKDLTQGRVLVTNWHVFEPQAPSVGGTSGKVNRSGQEVRRVETIHIGTKTTTARGSRYLTPEALQVQIAGGMLAVKKEHRDLQGSLIKVEVESVRYIESDTSLVNRILGKEVGGKQNILVMNDESHHAYRIKKDEPDEDEEDLYEDEEEADEFFKEATVWIDGLDRINKLRGINLCVDLSATPYFLGRVGQETNRPFPWVVSDFGLIDAIESGLVKVPQLAVRDTTGAEIPGYFNIWKWIIPKLTAAEKGGKKGNVKPEAILKYAHTPISMLGGLWEALAEEWKENDNDPRPPVFILVCKNTKIAKVVYEWLAEDKTPAKIPSAKIEGFRNRVGQTFLSASGSADRNVCPTTINTIRVDSKVVHETDSGGSKGDESRWLRFTLDTVGRRNWPADPMGRPIYPDGFEELATKLERPFHPPGRDIRCIISVGMLTEGWDCNTVTHVVGLRPFMSQLLCEQVVGRGLRRRSYEIGPDGKLTEEVAKVFGVPFEVIPFKASKQGPAPPAVKRHHIHAIPAKAAFEIKFPRVDGYTQAIRNRVTVNWPSVPKLVIDPNHIPPEVEVKGLSVNNQGRLSLSGPGKVDQVTLREFRAKRRIQELGFDLARTLTRDYLNCGPGRQECLPHGSSGADIPVCQLPLPVHVLFPQLLAIVARYIDEKVMALPPADKKDLFLSPYYGWLVERLVEAIQPDTSQGESPEVPRYETNRPAGSSSDVDLWTSRDVRDVIRSHLNYVVADTGKWEQSAAYYIDTHPDVAAFVKNSGLGFAIPYFHNGQTHEYFPDFLIRLKTERLTTLILEVKGFDPIEEIKAAAAQRWVAAVNADGTYGTWQYVIVRKPTEVRAAIDAAFKASNN